VEESAENGVPASPERGLDDRYVFEM